MRRLYSIIVGAGILGVMLIGCKDLDGPEGPAGPQRTGTIIGYVRLANEDQTTPYDRHGVTVTIAGSGLSAMSDSSGRFVLNGVTVGTIDLIASKAGYSDARLVSIPFPGGAPFFLSSWWGIMTLDHLPSFDVATVAAVPSASDVIVSGTINSSASWDRAVLLYFGRQAAISASNPGTYRFIYSTWVNGGTNAFGATIYQGTLEAYGFSSGDTVFVSAYPAGSQFYNTGYIDAATGKTVVSSVGTDSKSANVVMP